MKTCDNCGRENCNCAEHEKDLQETPPFMPMSDEVKADKIYETVRRWADQWAKEQEAKK